MDGAAPGIVGGGPVTNLEGLERWWNNPGIAAWSFVLFGCFLLNATLLLAFLVRPGLRTISNRFVMNLTVSNLLTCALMNPLLMLDGPSVVKSTLTPDAWSPSSFDTTSTSTSASASAGNICAISEGATALVTTSSVLSVLLIAVDQYFAVVDPLRYRARVDKLKSAVLIASVWLVSMAFSLIATLNPSPRSLWLSCTTLNNSSFRELVFNASINSTFASFDNGTDTEEVEEDVEIERTVMPNLLKTVESIEIDRSVGLFENSTVIFRTLTSDSVTYGLIYTVVHSVFAYLLPFAGVCWIYISIYSAAHRNSERTRRTGSRPILSSASFCEDPYGYARPQSTDVPAAEEVRRIPKISSLSSIDETSETAHSANPASRRRSFSSSSDAARETNPTDEKTSSGVVFTVGLQPMEVAASCEQDREDVRAENEPVASFEIRNEFRDSSADRRRKSSHDLMYEVVATCERPGWIAGGDSSGSESEDEQRYSCFDSLEVPESIRRVKSRSSSSYFMSLAGCEVAEQSQCEVTEVPGQRNPDERAVRCVVDEEKSSAAIRTPKCTTERRDQVIQNGGNLFLTPGDYSENRRLRRYSRRSSKSGVADYGNAESQSVSKNATENVKNNNAEPSSCLLTPIVTITPAPNKPGTLNRVSSVRSTNSSYINTLKHRISNGSLFRYREETRAARISALVIVMGLICWSPYVLLSVIKNLPQYSDYNFPHEYDVLALSFFILAAYLSPLLFGYRSKRVKRELRRFFCFRRELSYKNNRSLMAKKVLKRRHSSTLSHIEMDHRYNILNCVYGRNRWPKEKVQFVQVPDTALAVETCRSSFSSGASTQISSTSTEES